MAGRKPRDRGSARAPVRDRRASPRVLIGVGIAVALAIAAVAVAIVLLRDDETESAPPGTTTAATVEALPQAAEVEELFADIPQQGNQLGDPNAPAAMIEYVDLQCPYCAQFDTQAVPRIIERYVRSGDLLIELRPIATLGPDSARGRDAVIAAGLQGRFFQMAHLLYLNQGSENSGWVGDELLSSAAASISGLDVEQFQADRSSATVADQGGRFDAAARRQSVAVTPTIYVGKNGEPLQQVTPSFPADDATIARAIDQALEG